MADPLDKNTIDQLAAAIDKAMNGQGGSRPYDQSNWGERRSPAQKAADMKKADQTQKSMIATMTKLRDGMKTQGKSADQLADVLKASTSSMKRSMEVFGHNFEKAEKEFVKALNKTLESNKGMNVGLRTLAGKIEKMEDVFNFDDLTRAMVEMSDHLEKAKTHATTGKDVADRLLTIQKHLDKTDTTFTQIDPLLKDFDLLLKEISDINDNGKREFKNEAEVGHVLKDWLKNNKISPEAQQRIKDLGLAGVTAAAEKSAKGLQFHASLLNAANTKLRNFAEKTFTATAAIDLLVKAATQLYTTTKTAYGTGTEKGFGAVLARDFHSVANGVDPNVVQDIQVRNAMARGNMGRNSFDNATYKGINELTGITGDRNEAAKLQASLTTSLSKVNMSFDKMPGTIHKLNDSFLKLQYQTGINAEQFGQLQDQILGDDDTRRLMLGLQDKEKAAMIDSINKRIVENVQLGYSIDQTKEQIKLLDKLFDPLKPKSRFENSVKENVFLRTQGVNAQDSQAIANMDRAGGADKYKAQLVSQGMGDKQAQDYVQRLSNTRAKTAKNYQASLAKNDGTAFVNESLGDKLGMSGTYGSAAWLNGTPQTKEGNDGFQKAVGDFQKAVDSWSNITGKILSFGDRLTALSGSIIGTVLKAAGIALIAKQLGLIGSLTKAGKALFTSEGVKGLLAKGKGLFSKGANEAVAAAAPEIELVNGIPRAKAAAEAATGVKSGFSLMKAGKAGLGLTKGLAKGAPGLAVALAQTLVPENSTAGKLLNSNTVNGAMYGSMLGSVVPGVGTAVGGVAGGAIGAGMDAWDYFHQPNANPVPNATPNTPQAPTSSGVPLPPLPVNKTDADFAKDSAATFGKRGDPQQQQVEELRKQNDLLSKILAELKGQSDSLNDNGNKSVDAMTKLQRALKSMGNGDPDLVAASKYN